MSYVSRRHIGSVLQFSFDTLGLVAAWHATINVRLILNTFMQLRLTRGELYMLAPPLHIVLGLWALTGLWLFRYRPSKSAPAPGYLANLIESVMIATTIVTVTMFFVRQNGVPMSRSLVLLFMPVCLTCMLWARYAGIAVRFAIERMWLAPERVAVLGYGIEAKRIAECVRTAGGPWVALAGVIIPGEDSGDDSERELVATAPVLGSAKQLAEVINHKQLDRIIIVSGCMTDSDVDECGVISKRMGVVLSRALPVPTVPVHVEFGERFGLPLLDVRPVTFTHRQEIVKRCFDIAAAALMLLLLAPVLATFAVLIKLTSDGPVFYKSRRVGLGGRHFDFIKFRSMYANKMGRKHVAMQNEKSGHLFKLRNDPRVTPLGRIMRKYSIDELPQLINVLQGEMSLVGPRPLPAEDLDPDGHSREFRNWSEQRSRVLPGITGLWQISGRSDLSFERMIDLDIEYIRKWSLALDLRILIQTPVVVLTGKGAY